MQAPLFDLAHQCPADALAPVLRKDIPAFNMYVRALGALVERAFDESDDLSIRLTGQETGLVGRLEDPFRFRPDFGSVMMGPESVSQVGPCFDLLGRGFVEIHTRWITLNAPAAKASEQNSSRPDRKPIL